MDDLIDLQFFVFQGRIYSVERQRANQHICVDWHVVCLLEVCRCFSLSTPHELKPQETIESCYKRVLINESSNGLSGFQFFGLQVKVMQEEDFQRIYNACLLLPILSPVRVYTLIRG